MLKEISELIGKHVIYYDYVGIECYGSIVAIELYTTEDEVYVYIEDENGEENIHEDIVNGKRIKYSDIRLSSEIYLDERS